ncbi:MAG: hypothetical protein KKB51_12680 [Candidatus Riflebacteria bacterium]|nr:hypothetical protein [Candidatus Riflebacteria bacterium]
MKNVSVVLAVVLLLGFGIAVAQENTGQTNQTQNTTRTMRGKRHRAALNNGVQASQTVANTQVAPDTTTDTTAIKSTTCDGSGRGYGDGSKLQPKDGTGFGAKAQKRQHRNAKSGKGHGKGAKDGSAQRRQLRDGSCSGQNNTSTSTNQ